MVRTESRTPAPVRAGRRRTRSRRRTAAAIAAVVVAIAGAAVFAVVTGEPDPRDVPGTPQWARRYYGDPDAAGFRRRNIAEIEFLGRALFVHRAAARHFLRLERLFEARAPEYAAGVATGVLDDWSYANRVVRGGDSKSSHAFGIAIDVNALSNVLGTTGDMPAEVVRQWQVEGGAWGGRWSRPDPMHFETRLTPRQIRERYRPDGSLRAWYLEELVSSAPARGSSARRRT